LLEAFGKVLCEAGSAEKEKFLATMKVIKNEEHSTMDLNHTDQSNGQMCIVAGNKSDPVSLCKSHF
jgi:hypothetical protein